MIWPYSLTAPLLKDVQSQMPQAICEMTPNGGINEHVLINRDKPPFDNPDLRRALALSLDRKAFIDTLDQGQGDIGGVLQPPPEGLWGMPPELLKQLPSYDPDVEKNRAQARQIIRKVGYGPGKSLAIKVSTRDLPAFRNAAVGSVWLQSMAEMGAGAALQSRTVRVASIASPFGRLKAASRSSCTRPRPSRDRGRGPSARAAPR